VTTTLAKGVNNKQRSVPLDCNAFFGFTGDDMRRGDDTTSLGISKDVEPLPQQTHVCNGREGHLPASSIPDTFAACNAVSANVKSCDSNPNVRMQHIALPPMPYNLASNIPVVQHTVI
jgi:hypothetical protein